MKVIGVVLLGVGLLLSFYSGTLWVDSEDEDCDFGEYKCQHQQRIAASQAKASEQLSLVIVFIGIGLIVYKEEIKCKRKKK